MPQTLGRPHIDLVFNTKNRQRILRPCIGRTAHYREQHGRSLYSLSFVTFVLQSVRIAHFGEDFLSRIARIARIKVARPETIPNPYFVVEICYLRFRRFGCGFAAM
jgi:hypothetical protein